MIISISGNGIKFYLDKKSENYHLVGPVVIRSDPNYLTRRQTGIYINTNLVTGEQYISSLIDLARRLINYTLYLIHYTLYIIHYTADLKQN